MKTDIEIAQECMMEPITKVAEKAGIPEEYLEQYGKYKAKIDYNFLKKSDKEDGKLILVTAINPTPAGEGKTTTTVGLADALRAEDTRRLFRWKISIFILREIFMRSELRITYWQQ